MSMTISESQKCMRQSYISSHLMSMRHAYIVDGWSRRQPSIILVHLRSRWLTASRVPQPRFRRADQRLR